MGYKRSFSGKRCLRNTVRVIVTHVHTCVSQAARLQWFEEHLQGRLGGFSPIPGTSPMPGRSPGGSPRIAAPISSAGFFSAVPPIFSVPIPSAVPISSTVPISLSAPEAFTAMLPEGPNCLVRGVRQIQEMLLREVGGEGVCSDGVHSLGAVAEHGSDSDHLPPAVAEASAGAFEPRPSGSSRGAVDSNGAEAITSSSAAAPPHFKAPHRAAPEPSALSAEAAFSRLSVTKPPPAPKGMLEPSNLQGLSPNQASPFAQPPLQEGPPKPSFNSNPFTFPSYRTPMPQVMYFRMGGGTGQRLPVSGRLDHGGQWMKAVTWPMPFQVGAAAGVNEV